MTKLHATSKKRIIPPRFVLLVLLYLFAAPVYIVRFVMRSVRTFVRFRAVWSGTILCPHCGTENALDLLATCRRCGVTEFGSRLHCSNCGQTNRGFACDACGAFIRVL
jgi:hypothetical protein